VCDGRRCFFRQLLTLVGKKYIGKVIQACCPMKTYGNDTIFPSAWGAEKAVLRPWKDFSEV
jgi:hypothetical protein